ncbi:MAG: hypothetical protein HQL20_05980 [Candidatus Omnitrophica bacterium]|nr:hypothetical protein [Candidatus Omnitrophota bacterium]
MKKTFLFLKYTLCFLLCLEAFLWIGSWVTQSTQKISNVQQASAKNTFRILCVGESNTLVGGKESYPSQLQDILNERLPGRNIEVINQGMAGYSTERIAQELPEWLKTMKPDMVLAMIGIYDVEQIRRDKVSAESASLGFMQNVKLYRLALQLQQKIFASLQEYVQRQKQQFTSRAQQQMAGLTEHEMFQNAIKDAPEDLRKLYVLIVLTEGNAKTEIADQLFARFFSLNKNPLIYRWVIKQYGRFLMRNKLYEKFITVLEDIPTNAWSMDWVNSYCDSTENVNKVREAIERKVRKTDETDAYGYVAACLEKNGQKDLAAAFIKEKIGTFRDAYASESTRKNYLAVKDLLIAKKVRPVFIQYPLRDLAPLKAIFASQPDKDRIVFVDNGPVFKAAVAASSYATYFVDRASGDTGHATPLGKHLLAENIANTIMPYLKN